MHHNIENPACEKCGSKESEFFNQTHKSGRRCLGCGHEGDITDTSMSAPSHSAWILDKTTERTF